MFRLVILLYLVQDYRVGEMSSPWGRNVLGSTRGECINSIEPEYSSEWQVFEVPVHLHSTGTGLMVLQVRQTGNANLLTFFHFFRSPSVHPAVKNQMFDLSRVFPLYYYYYYYHCTAGDTTSVNCNEAMNRRHVLAFKRSTVEMCLEFTFES